MRWELDSTAPSRFGYEHQPAVGFVSSTTNKRHYTQDGKECGSVGVAPSSEKQKVNLDRWLVCTKVPIAKQALKHCHDASSSAEV